MINIFLLYLLYLLHIFLVFIVVGLPFLTKKIYLLLLIILFNIIVVTGWYIHGYCICNDIEDYLLEKREERIENKSFISSFVENNLSFLMDEKYISKVISSIPLVSTIICIYKIHKNLYICRRKR